MKLSIIIVNYNVQFFLENCLNSVVQAIEGLEAEVLVVDNNSVDGSAEMLAQKFPNIRSIINSENLGFSKANNQAIKLAKGEYILLLNPDTVVEESTFTQCCRYLDKHQNVGGLGLKMLDGKGNFLPESKRGLPTPLVAFYKIFGLSNLFPKSKTFGQYHLGHLSKEKTHEVEILSGAFMMIRKKVLDQIGLLDESFFMYGEDIDLSYRITQAGFQNVYFADTSIIHYKGESTKKSSINYVFVFYRAMAIFAKKHFSSNHAKLFGIFINFAIYLRASFALLTRTARHLLLPIIDGSLMYFGISIFKAYYETKVKFVQGGSYPEEVEILGIPLVVLLYLVSGWLNGSYSIPTRFFNLLKGVFTGSLLLLIFYGLLPEDYRFSRAIVLFAVLWSLFAVPAIRFLLDTLGIRKFYRSKIQRIALVGKKEELNRISNFLKNTPQQPELICYINPNQVDDDYPYTGKINHLRDIVEIYKLTEIIFCSKDITSSAIMEQMANLNSSSVDFKIAPPESIYIIGSNSIESSGEFYIIGANALLKPINQRNKRIIEVSLSLLFLLGSPLLMFFNRMQWLGLASNLTGVLLGRINLVGFINSDKFLKQNLKIKRGILNPADLFQVELKTEELIERVNFEYGKNYSVLKDLEIVFKNLNKLSRPVNPK